MDNLSKKLIIKDAAQRQLDKWAGKALRAVEKHIGPATEVRFISKSVGFAFPSIILRVLVQISKSQII